MKELSEKLLKELNKAYPKSIPIRILLTHGYEKTVLDDAEKSNLVDSETIPELDENGVQVAKHLERALKINLKGIEFLKSGTLSNRLKEISHNPLAVALITFIITTPMTAYITYQLSIASINYQYESQNQLKVIITSSKELGGEPDRDYTYNSIGLYNPSQNTISLESIRYFPSEGWFSKIESTLKENESKSELPTFLTIENIEQASYEPYMILKAGDYKQISGFFKLHTPKKEGDYYLKFCAYTLDKKQFCSEDSLTIHVKANQTNLR